MFNKRIKQIIKDLLPPVILKKYYNLNLNFKGSHSSWEEAKKLSIGHDADIVLDKTKKQMLEMKDSVLFDSACYPFPVLVGLLKSALSNDGTVNVLDFGGSLGSLYFQYRNFLKGIKIKWSVVEQPKIVDCGKDMFENEELKFYYSIDQCLKNEKPHVVILSGVIQYIERPHSLIEEMLKRKFDYLIFHRTPFLKNGPDKLTIQKAPPNTHNCDFPHWFFNYDNFVAKLLSKYELIADFDDAIDRIGEPMFYKGLILKLKQEENSNVLLLESQLNERAYWK